MSKLSLWRAVSLVSVFYALAVVGLPAPTFTTLASFNGTDGVEPVSGLVRGFNATSMAQLLAAAPTTLEPSSRSPRPGN
jgi:hypothetical protein